MMSTFSLHELNTFYQRTRNALLENSIFLPKNLILSTRELHIFYTRTGYLFYTRPSPYLLPENPVFFTRELFSTRKLRRTPYFLPENSIFSSRELDIFLPENSIFSTIKIHIFYQWTCKALDYCTSTTTESSCFKRAVERCAGLG